MTTSIKSASDIKFYNNGGADIHMWCEQKNETGKIIKNDYDTNTFVSMKKTDKIIYKSLTTKENNIAWKMIYKRIIKPRLDQMAKLSSEEKNYCIKYFIENNGNCIMRSYFLALNSDGKLKIKIGSLGFQQKDGSIFWEYG